MKDSYTKKWIPIVDQLQKLSDAGLIFEDRVAVRPI